MWYPGNTYPYSNFHDLNLDWVLYEIKTLREMVEAFEEEMLKKAYAYTDTEIAKAKAEIYAAIEKLRQDIQIQIDAFEKEITDFKTEVREELENTKKYLEQEIADIEARVVYFETLIDQKIEANNDYLLDELQKGMANLYVINYFTGERVKIQAMFDYLAMLHLEDALRYDELKAREITYDALIALNMTYTDLIAKGAILIPAKG